jgi:hypothetical protein
MLIFDKSMLFLDIYISIKLHILKNMGKNISIMTFFIRYLSPSPTLMNSLRISFNNFKYPHRQHKYTMMSFCRNLITPLAIVLIICHTALAIHQGGTEDGHLLPYSQQMTHPLDDPINRALSNKSFMMNLGPTGIRADIRPEYPKAFKVKFVFQDNHSPAKGLIKPGDMIIGVGGKEFNVPHKFHRKKGGRGWPGPPLELAAAIETAQGGSGKLTLLVLQGGSNSKRKSVTLKLKPVGKFSKTWPWNCERSDQLLKDLLDFSFDGNLDRMKRHHRIQMLLALWASGDHRAIPHVESYAKKLMKSNPTYKSPGMGTTWMWGYNGIFLGEYYYMTKDKGVLPVIDALNKCYEHGQYDNGSYGHRPRLSFLLSDRKPYATMAAAGGICMLAQSIFRASGLPYNPKAYQKTHLGYLRTAGPNSGGSVAYGFTSSKQKEQPTDHAVLKVKGKIKEPKARSYFPEIGGKEMPIKGGLRGIGSYTVQWPHPKDPRWRNGCIDWLKKEANNVEVRWAGKDTVVAWRPLPTIMPKEPTSPYRTTPDGCGHQAGPGPGALAHLIGNKGNKSWEYLGMHMATGCALSPKMLWDGHADAVIHSFFGALAAGMANKKDLRTWLDYTKTWIILSETHEPRSKGGLVDQPFGCQRNGTASIARGRTAYTHVAIAALSLPKRRLLLTGAPSRQQDSENPMQYLIDASFSIQHCHNEAKMIERGSGFKKVLASLRKSIDNDKNKEEQSEATEFYARLKEWIIERSLDEIHDSKSKPGQMLPKLEEWVKMVKELPPESLIKDRIDEIKNYQKASQYLKIYKSYATIQDKMSKSGYTSSSTKSIDRLKNDLKKLIDNNEGEASMIQEAKSFRDQL